MKLKQLTMLHRCDGQIPSWLVAAWNWKWSVTWRWGVWYSRRNTGRYGFYFRRVYRGFQGFNFHCGLNLPFLGFVSIQTQPNMPWRKEA